MKVSAKSHGPEKPEESFMLAERFVYRQIEGASMKTDEKSRIEKMPVFEKKIGYSLLGLKKPNLGQKLFILKNLTKL